MRVCEMHEQIHIDKSTWVAHTSNYMIGISFVSNDGSISNLHEAQCSAETDL